MCVIFSGKLNWLLAESGGSNRGAMKPIAINCIAYLFMWLIFHLVCSQSLTIPGSNLSIGRSSVSMVERRDQANLSMVRIVHWYRIVCIALYSLYIFTFHIYSGVVSYCNNCHFGKHPMGPRPFYTLHCQHRIGRVMYAHIQWKNGRFRLIEVDTSKCMLSFSFFHPPHITICLQMFIHFKHSLFHIYIVS